MKLTDIPKHVTDMNPPWFSHSYFAKYKTHADVLDEVKPLYHLNYWDGPLSGIFQVEDNYFYGKAIYGELERRWWACWELTGDDLTKEQERHRLFQQYVGTHTDYHQDENECWVRDIGTCKPRESCDIYYKMENKPQVDYKEIESREIFGILRNPFWDW